MINDSGAHVPYLPIEAKIESRENLRAKRY